jgi:F0F1-type ATP synthase assembly protein I
MANTDKLLLICIIFMIVGFSVAIFDVQKRSYDKGVRDGYHRGRSYKGQE